MSRLDELPPDQRATLSLLLLQRKSYAEVSVLLGISESAVHDRAHAALAVLAPRLARELAPERRAEIADFMLGQQAGIAERLQTRTYLGSAEPARAWAQALADELGVLGAAGLPDVPPAASVATPAGMAAAGASAATATVPPPARERVADLSAAPRGTSSPATGEPRASRLGGALLLAALLVAAVVAVILIANNGGSGSKPKASSSTSTTTGTSKTTGPKVSAQLPIKPPDASSKSIGVVEVLTENGKRAFYIAAEHLPPSKHFFYAVWLYNSHTSAVPVSKAPAVGSDHKLAGGALLPENAGSYREVLLTRETSTHPTHPGHVVLRGPFKLQS
jgi:sigma-70-like protein